MIKNGKPHSLKQIQDGYFATPQNYSLSANCLQPVYLPASFKQSTKSNRS